MRESIRLPGLDGSTMLGFVAAIGVLEALQCTTKGGSTTPTLSWGFEGGWAPIVTGVASEDEIVERVLLDARSELVEQVLRFEYLKVEKAGTKRVSSLKPPVAVLRKALLRSLRADAHGVAEFLAALCCETALSPADDTKVADAQALRAAGIDFDEDARLDMMAEPTPFDFTSRNVQFLDQLKLIRGALTFDRIDQQLFHGLGSDSDRIMRWDSRVDTPASLFERARATTQPVAEWLAFRGVRSFVLSTVGSRLAMPGFQGRRKAGDFTWVLWEGPLSLEVVRSVLAHRWELEPSAGASAKGILAAFSVAFRKDATGYDGVVSAAVPVSFPT